MKIKYSILLGMLVVLLFVLPPVARAAPLYATNYCFPTYIEERCVSLMQVVENWGQRAFAGLAIGMMQWAAKLIWLVDRAAAFIFTKTVVDTGWLLNLKDQMADAFAGLMPGLIRDIAFGSGGLMYIAMSIAGLLMMLPAWGNGARFVRPERVMIWGVVLSLLFVSGSFGYDFINVVEDFRHGLVAGVLQGSALPMDNLIQQPMFAGAGDTGFGSDLLALPPAYESTYFPEPQLTEVTISEGGGFGFGNATIETAEMIAQRTLLAGHGMFYAVVSVFGAALLLQVGFTYVILSFTALLLIMFLFAALPLGFFETGGMVLNDLIGRYFQVTIQSLTLAIFLRWLSSGLGYIVEVNSVTNSLTWLIVLVVMIVVTGTFMNGALKLLMQSGQSFKQASVMFGGPGLAETARSSFGQTVASVAGGVSTLALLAGRPEVAMAAGAVQAGSARINPQTQSAVSQGSESIPMARGNVFAENGMQASPPQGTSTGMSAPQHLPVQSIQNPTPSQPEPFMPQATLQTIAARQGWDAVQMRQIEESARETKTPQEAVQRLQQAPGFERAAPKELQQAVEAARLGTNTRTIS